MIRLFSDEQRNNFRSGKPIGTSSNGKIRLFSDEQRTAFKKVSKYDSLIEQSWKIEEQAQEEIKKATSFGSILKGTIGLGEPGLGAIGRIGKAIGGYGKAIVKEPKEAAKGVFETGVLKPISFVQKVLQPSVEQKPISEILGEPENEEAQKARNVGEFLGWLLPYSAVSKATGIAIRGITKSPKIAKLIPAISDTVGFLGTGQILYDDGEGTSRLKQLRNDAILLGVFKSAGLAYRGLKPGGAIKGEIETLLKDTKALFEKPKKISVKNLDKVETNVVKINNLIKQDTGSTAKELLQKEIIEKPKIRLFSDAERASFEKIKAEPLAQEARKYKSAEEFVEAQGRPLFHGTDVEFDTFDIAKAGTKKTSDWGTVGVYFDPNKSGANYYRQQAVRKSDKTADKLYQAYLDKLKEFGTKPMFEGLDLGVGSAKHKEVKALQNKWRHYLETIDEDISKGRIVEAYINKDANVYKYVHEGGTPDNFLADMKMGQGYDAVEIWYRNSDTGKEILEEVIVMHPRVLKTKSQLTDIYTQATKGVGKVVAKKKPSGIALSIEAKSIEKELTKEFKGLAEFTPTTIKKQARKMAQEMKDIENVKSMVRGDVALSEGLSPSTVITTMEKYAYKNKDGELMAELAKSPLLSKISIGAQDLSLMSQREKESAVTQIKSVIKTREKGVERKLKFKTPEKIKSTITKSLEKEIKKTKPTKYSWQKLMDDIQC